MEGIINVKVFEDGNNLFYYCPFCKELHKHGAGGASYKLYGGRCPHCHDEKGANFGVNLIRYTNKELKYIIKCCEKTLKERQGLKRNH